MSKYIKGDAVANATSYELHEKVGSNYNLLDTKNEIDFELDGLALDSGVHTLVVKAKAQISRAITDLIYFIFLILQTSSFVDIVTYFN